ncbi:hypothetical protein JXM67_01310 [candidate division WOR-3 bacterium]|nr:hypothetical protein [candidate division WOR-3 bacterium]
MLKYKKIILTVLAAAVILGAAPAFAQLYGTWKGDGRGNCYPHPGVVIYPWQDWKGEVFVSPDEDIILFTGDWYDALGNHGIFKGRVEFSPIPELAIAKGSWFWFDPTGTAEPVYGGDFKMNFWFTMNRCDGHWTTIWPSTSAEGTMKGKKVE